MSVNAGDLRQVIEIQRLQSVADDCGYQIEEWITIAQVRAKTEFDDRLMREIVRDGGSDCTTVKIFTFRYINDLDMKDRIIFNGVAYKIYGINNINDEQRYLKVWARALWQ